ncbi:MAG: glycosyltransferase [Steroidobacteraceae bacterium]
MDSETTSHCGVVVIGRNEGERLKVCLASVLQVTRQVVYVDSASTDGSAGLARSMALEVVDLDLSRPFTAARARNEGSSRLLLRYPKVELIQFVDGDCEVQPGWLEHAAEFLRLHPEVAVACGRRRERFPHASIFNAQCDREWNTPIGDAKACGGDAMMRRAAFEESEGFRSSLIAGEEPELCLRLRAMGWKIWRLDREMTMHDAAIRRWGQWWSRARRTGYAYAEGAWLHGAPPERHWVSETRRAVLWGVALPLLVFGAALFLSRFFIVMLLIYPLQVLRLSARSGDMRWNEVVQAMLLVLGKFPESHGILKFWTGRLRARPAAIIEYK